MGLFGNSAKSNFPWVKLTSTEQLDELIARSHEIPVLLFKHSTSCGISAMAINRFQSTWKADEQKCIPVLLDLLAYRSVSNAVAEKTGVMHESPQAILLKNGEVKHVSTHGSIDAAEIQSLL
jgi:bacillithiol system protein YtxJ